jgi:hypothetical protein
VEGMMTWKGEVKRRRRNRAAHNYPPDRGMSFRKWKTSLLVVEIIVIGWMGIQWPK